MRFRPLPYLNVAFYRRNYEWRLPPSPSLSPYATTHIFGMRTHANNYSRCDLIANPIYNNVTPINLTNPPPPPFPLHSMNGHCPYYPPPSNATALTKHYFFQDFM